MTIGAEGKSEDDPKVILVHYYQKLSPPITLSFKTAFKDYNDAPLGSNFSGTQYWRSEFHCPISRQIYHSGLNYLQLMEASATSFSQAKMEQQEYIVSSDYVYFRTKKASQRSAAKAALEMLMGQQRTLFRSFQEVWQYQHPDEQQKQLERNNSLIKISSFLIPSDDDDDDVDYDENSSLEEDEGDNGSQNKLPNTINNYGNSSAWAERMYQLGIRSPNQFCMFFSQVSNSSMSASLNKNIDNQSNKRSTFIRCCIDTFAPKRLTAWGAPARTKVDAIASAVTLLEEVLTNNGSDGREASSGKKAFSSLEAVAQLRKCVPTICRYNFSLLPCFTKPILTTASSPLFLYELTFSLTSTSERTGTSGYEFTDFTSLVSHLCGLEQSTTKLSRLGILFPMDVMPTTSRATTNRKPSLEMHNTTKNAFDNGVETTDTSKIKATFTLGSLNKNIALPVEVDVQLTSRTLIDPITQHQLDLTKHFHDTMDLWKLYGLIDQNQQLLKSSNQGKTFSPMDRTYLLVPLLPTNASSDESDHTLRIDWNLLNKLFNGEVTPYIEKKYRRMLIFSSALTAFIILLCSVVLLYCGDHEDGRKEQTTISIYFAFQNLLHISVCDYYRRQRFLFLFCTAVAGFMFVAFFSKTKILKDVTEFGVEYAQNKFMVQEIKGSRKIYIPCNNKKDVKFPLNYLYELYEATAIPSQEHLTSQSREAHLKKYNGLDLATATYVDYYFKKYGIKIKHKFVPLIPARVYHSTSKLATDCSDSVVHIVPELVNVLPLPRDILFMSQYRTSYLTSIEIAVSIFHVESWLRDLAVKVSFLMPMITEANKVNNRSSHHDQQGERDRYRLSTADYLKDALCHNCQGNGNAFQRLEFVGDAVLGYYTAINLFSRNACLHWNVDDLEQFSSHAVKNSTIFEAALHVGIPSLIITSDATKWLSAYARARDVSDVNYYPTCEISDKNISDTVEAVLGAIHLGHSKTEGSHHITIGFLNELNLPFRPRLFPNFDLDLPEKNPFWFTARGSCTNEGGYPFKLDKKWLDEIVNIGTIIYLEHDVTRILDEGRITLLDIFVSNKASVLAIGQTKFSEILFFTALFDDSLRDDEEQSLVTSSSVGAGSSFARSEDSDNSSRKGEEAVGLVRVALFRDTLFVIGNAALMLCLAEECYYRYPCATEGDLHLMKTWTLSNDVLAYLMVKNGFHKCLFDKHAQATVKFSQKMIESDALGEDIWNRHGGWILPGGLVEFQRRTATDGKSSERKPKYVGLSHGKLIGAKKKLPSELTGDLVFSMKAICGALVLSFGLEQAWEQFLLPIFEELLLISPDEWINHVEASMNIEKQ